jgi:hypothetical protein
MLEDEACLQLSGSSTRQIHRQAGNLINQTFLTALPDLSGFSI